MGFDTFEYKSGTIIIPVQSWDTDVEGPPEMGEEVADELHERGTKILAALVDYLVDFVKKYDEIDISGIKTNSHQKCLRIHPENIIFR